MERPRILNMMPSDDLHSKMKSQGNGDVPSKSNVISFISFGKIYAFAAEKASLPSGLDTNIFPNFFISIFTNYS